MKEHKTLNDLISYYENKCEYLRYISFPCDQDDFIKHRTQQKEDEEILSQLKKLKEDIVKQSFGEDGYERVYIEIYKVLGVENNE